ncbi:hypothetical protein QVD17_28989 [Tagetes erecta]|uniref:Uncharacterized protein n=1 Tax=Tagetes erecta TaxID=13708 RepID=A0AAD8KHI7_TARER|nr:hypothetical protein QVD17_28989 [Tagetes erecta]
MTADRFGLGLTLETADRFGLEFGVISLVSATFSTWYSSILIVSLWKWDGKKCTTHPHLARSIYVRQTQKETVVISYGDARQSQEDQSVRLELEKERAAKENLENCVKHLEKDREEEREQSRVEREKEWAERERLQKRKDDIIKRIG